jgi:hypothetical protein
VVKLIEASPSPVAVSTRSRCVQQDRRFGVVGIELATLQSVTQGD